MRKLCPFWILIDDYENGVGMDDESFRVAR